MKICVFDIETGPLPDEEIARIAPPFNEDKVKVGNLGLEKQLAKVKEARENHLAKIKNKAALNGEYGRVLACGFAQGDATEWVSVNEVESLFIAEETDKAEAALLKKIWARLGKARESHCLLVGHNSNAFDLPHLLRRSFILHVRPLWEIVPNRRYFPDFCVDLMDAWRMGDYDPEKRIGLDRLAKAMGFEGKSGSGKYFAETWRNDPDAAKEYLETDIRVTWRVAARIIPYVRQY